VLPASKRDLASLKEFTGRASRSQLDRWWAAIEAGMASDDLPVLRQPGDSIPPPRVWSEKNPEADKRLKAARAAVTAVGERMSIPVENLLTPETLRRVAWTPPETVDAASIASALEDLGARSWQVGATAQVIAQAFVDSTQSPEEPEPAAS
jgi:ribonuclease D